MRRARCLAILGLLAAGMLPATSLAWEASPPVDERLGPEQLVGPPAGTPVAVPALEAHTTAVASLVRCPVCQGLSVADSPATMAVNMKMQVRGMLARGYTDEQILSYFERSYGEFVRLQPPLRGVNWLVWIAPVAGLLLGSVVVIRALRVRGAAGVGAPGPVGAPLPARDTLPESADLASYVRRVRELAYRWPGGIPPGEED